MKIIGSDLIVGSIEINLAWLLVLFILLAFYFTHLHPNRRKRKTSKNQQDILWQQKSEQYEKTQKDIFNKYVSAIHQLQNDTLQCSPWMAEHFADLLYLYDMELSRYLADKPHPAYKASQEVSEIAKEKRALQKENKMLKYQLAFYENAFPWLEDFKEIDAKDAWNYARGIGEESKDEYEQLKNWLSPEEYQELPTAEKYQLALERYTKRKKTNWEIGIDYERFIGYKLEAEGFKVKYQGALLGLEDMGRDLVATKDDEVIVVQCKRWAKDKTIHEKHIFQLYGSVVLLAMENSTKQCRGIFVTTTTLSDKAKQCADFLGISRIENYDLTEYPLIKCNISKTGEKIYHLPFDQHYDRVEISTKEHAFYAKTVNEAESQGFRRAYRWNPNKK